MALSSGVGRTSGGLLDFTTDFPGVLLRAPLRISSRGEPGMVFLALPGVDFLMGGATAVFSEEVSSIFIFKSLLCVSALNSTFFSLMTGGKRTKRMHNLFFKSCIQFVECYLHCIYTT